MSSGVDFSALKDLAVILIPSIVTLVTLYFTFTQKRKDGQSDFEIDNKRSQLLYIFKPLEKILQKYDYKTSKLKKSERRENEKKLSPLKNELEPFIKMMERQHLLLMPPNLIAAFYNTKEKIPLSRFVKIHNSYYNWLKRELKYPYDNNNIKRAYIMDHSMGLSMYELWDSLKTILTGVFLYLASVFCLTFIYIVLANMLITVFKLPAIDQYPVIATLILLGIAIVPLPLLIITIRKSS